MRPWRGLGDSLWTHASNSSEDGHSVRLRKRPPSKGGRTKEMGTILRSRTWAVAEEFSAAHAFID